MGIDGIIGQQRTDGEGGMGRGGEVCAREIRLRNDESVVNQCAKIREWSGAG